MSLTYKCSMLLTILFFGVVPDHAQSLPHLQRQGDATQLVVSGKPLLILGGELHNSIAGTAEEADLVLPKLAQAKVNTVLMPVSWELLEAKEGFFDFSIVDHWIQVARAQKLHLVLLWFGSWKNGASSYVPFWVKRDTKRFPRVLAADGQSLEILSTLSENNLHADQNAFRQLMRHLRQTDAGEQTVVMVQVENEVGVGGSTRDRSVEADRLFNGSAPESLMNDLEAHPQRISPELARAWTGKKGTWAEVFGHDAAASEIFMAWHYARYIDQVAAAGKAEYALPMYVNAQLPAPHERPGEYPSGGPHSAYLEVWRAAAPTLDFFSPDIYWPDFDYWCQRYQENGNPLFVPEARYEASPFNAFYAFGEAHAFGFSPFGIDSIPDATREPEAAARNQVISAYSVLDQLKALLPQAESENRTRGIVLHNTSPRASQTVSLGGYLFQASLARSFPANELLQNDGSMLVLEQGSNEFLIGGSGLRINISRDLDQEVGQAGIETVEQGSLVDGVWKTAQRLNGDEDNQGHSVSLPAHTFALLRVKLYKLP